VGFGTVLEDAWTLSNCVGYGKGRSVPFGRSGCDDGECISGDCVILAVVQVVRVRTILWCWHVRASNVVVRSLVSLLRVYDGVQRMVRMRGSIL